MPADGSNPAQRGVRHVPAFDHQQLISHRRAWQRVNIADISLSFMSAISPKAVKERELKRLVKCALSHVATAGLSLRAAYPLQMLA
jgi:hypothetical protein